MGLSPRATDGVAADPDAASMEPDVASRMMEEALRPDLFDGGGAIWRKATVALRDDAAPSADETFARATRGAGSEVPYRAQLEASFGFDLGDVRAYHGHDDALDTLGAEAATRGDRIAFGSASPSLALVAHEVAHVAQARAHGGGGVHGKDAVSSPDHAAEHEADAVAARVVRGERVTVSAAPRAAISLSGKCKLATGHQIEIGQDKFLPGHAVFTVQESREELLHLLEEASGAQITLSYAGKKYIVPVTWLDLGSYAETKALTGGKEFKDTRNLVKGEDQDTEKRSRRFMGLEDQRRSIQQEHDQTGGTSNASFTQPIAVAGDEDSILVETWVHTKNKWDRLSWSYKFVSASGKEAWPDSARTWWNNPAWGQEVQETYRVKTTFGADTDKHNDGQGGVRRPIRFTIRTADLKEFFQRDGGASESSLVTLGMKLYYGGDGPTTATKDEQADAYRGSPLDHNWGFLRGDPEGGRVDLTGVAKACGLLEGKWLRDEQVWQQPLPRHPSPNKTKAFPIGYAKDHPSFQPLVPRGKRDGEMIQPVAPGTRDSKLNLATRIENEATLKVSSGGARLRLIEALEQMVGKPGFDDLMQDGGLLSKFTWSLHHENEGKELVFTDTYLDDPEHRALRSGIGIRKRQSDTATKLNVKSGEGYQVGKLDGGRELEGGRETKSDIFRRHEVGFDLDPEAMPGQIGTYLGQGTDGSDPWNKGGQQANLTSERKGNGPIDWARLQGTMVLQGHRRKFKVQALVKGGNTPINIEISCDHTVGRRFEGLDGRESPEAMFPKFGVTYQDLYNVEMELEHLGTGAPPPTTQSFEEKGVHEGSSSSTDEISIEGSSHDVPTGAVHPTHPGRMYLHDDTSAPQFNTPSYEVFYAAHDRLIAWLRKCTTEGELGQDRQKLESMYDLLFG